MLPRVLRTIAFALVLFPTFASALEVTDDAGHRIVLDRPVKRVISLAPFATELLYEIGAGDTLIATTEYSDYPAEAKTLPRVGGLAGIDAERIVSFRPDLVIAWRSGTPEVQLAALERLGVKVYRSEPLTLAGVSSSMRRFGVLTGHDDDGRRRAVSFDARIASLRAQYATRPPVRVFYQVWASPLMTVGGRQIISSVIELCGGRNVFGQLDALAPTVDPEALVAADPQLIATASETGTRATDEAQWNRWTTVSAVRHRRYLFLDPALITRHSSRILDGTETMCRAIDAARADP